MKPFDAEVMLLGMTLRYSDTVKVVLPELTPDKFIFNMDGSFGNEHSLIWQSIADLFLVDEVCPTLADVAAKLPDSFGAYVRSTVDRLEKQYGIYEYTDAQVTRLGQLIDRQGVVYNVSRQLHTVGILATDLDSFQRNVETIDCVETWINDIWHGIQAKLKVGGNGYQHISTAVQNQIDLWERQFRGEQLDILPCGMPSLVARHLFPLRRIAAVHGLPNSGKSALVHQVNLGTAMGLVANGIKGCVAINSLEMSKEDLVNRYAAALAQVDVSRFRGGKTPVTREELNSLVAWAELIADLPIFIDDTNLITTSAMTYKSSGLHVSEYGPIMQLSSDYTELFADEDDSEELRVHKIFKNQMLISRELGCSVIAIGQSTPSGNASGIAGALGTRYSKGIFQNADVLVEVWNPVEMAKMQIRTSPPEGLTDSNPWLLVEKYREGSKGAIPLGWVPEYTLFYDLELNGIERNKTVFSHVEAARDVLKTKRVVHPSDIGGMW